MTQSLAEERKKRGFAIVLVAGLAAMVLLLGVSLVSFMQVESAILNYDQRMGLARDNARLALDMAVGDLQRFAGRDKAITMLGDAFRTPVDEDFLDNSQPTGVIEPFWTGVWDGDDVSADPIWLVTRPMGSDFDTSSATSELADPRVALDASVRSVTLVGPSTATFGGGDGTQDDFDVSVPVEEIRTGGLLNLGEAAVGHYGYWVGDLGVKASMVLRDRTADVDHDIYSGIDGDQYRERLKQMYGQGYAFSSGLFDPDSTENVLRIDGFGNDFQFRQAFGTNPYAHLDDLTMNEVLKSFHDYTPISRGVLVDSLNGGLKKDLSFIDSSNPISFTGDAPSDTELNAYLNYSSLPSTELSLLARSYSIQASGPRIAPVLTEFHIDFAFTVNTSKELEVSYNGLFELWNPYTSSLDAESLTIEVLGLPVLDVQYESGGELRPSVDVLDLNAAMPSPMFTLPTLVGGEEWWAPGKVTAFSGGATLTVHSGNITVEPVVVDAADVPLFDDDALGTAPDDEDFILIDDNALGSTPIVVIRSGGVEIARYSVSDPFGEIDGRLEIDESLEFDAIGKAFGFTWEMETPNDPHWTENDPRKTPYEIPTSQIHAWEADPGTHATYDYNDDDSLFFRDNPASTDVSFNKPMFELPRQDLVSLASLQSAVLSSPYSARQVGSVGTSDSLNNVFDEYFLSTVPQSGSWSELPNTRMSRIHGATDAQLGSVDSAQYLSVDGSFNINSTSINAWAALLGSCRLDEWTFVDEDATDTIDFDGGSVFPVYAQSAEETWQEGDVALTTEQRAYRRGLISVTEPQLLAMATQIVAAIRLNGPYATLKEFIDDGVIQDAIDYDHSVNSLEINFNASPEQPGYLRQSDVLTVIAPFISVRSDTFLVRAYGDAVNPRDSTDIWARAYCEAIVQRLPEKHASDTTAVMDPTDPAKFGRQFKVIAFRWMDANEI